MQRLETVSAIEKAAHKFMYHTWKSIMYVQLAHGLTDCSVIVPFFIFGLQLTKSWVEHETNKKFKAVWRHRGDID
jgi:hypothetical protein